MRNAIKRQWRYPCIPIGAMGRCSYVSTFLVTEFGIAKSGDLDFVDVLVPSEESLMDDTAVSAIRSAAPFGPAPDTLRKQGVPIVATFNYVNQDESPSWEWMTAPDAGRPLSTPRSRDVWSSLQPVRHRPSGTLRLTPSPIRSGAIGFRCVDN